MFLICMCATTTSWQPKMNESSKKIIVFLMFLVPHFHSDNFLSISYSIMYTFLIES